MECEFGLAPRSALNHDTLIEKVFCTCSMHPATPPECAETDTRQQEHRRTAHATHPSRLLPNSIILDTFARSADFRRRCQHGQEDAIAIAGDFVGATADDLIERASDRLRGQYLELCPNGGNESVDGLDRECASKVRTALDLQDIVSRARLAAAEFDAQFASGSLLVVAFEHQPTRCTSVSTR